MSSRRESSAQKRSFGSDEQKNSRIPFLKCHTDRCARRTSVNLGLLFMIYALDDFKRERERVKERGISPTTPLFGHNAVESHSLCVVIKGRQFSRMNGRNSPRCDRFRSRRRARGVASDAATDSRRRRPYTFTTRQQTALRKFSFPPLSLSLSLKRLHRVPLRGLFSPRTRRIAQTMQRAPALAENASRPTNPIVRSREIAARRYRLVRLRRQFDIWTACISAVIEGGEFR